MWTEREKAIRNVLLEQVGRIAPAGQERTLSDAGSAAHLARIERGMDVNKRRTVVFSFLFTVVLLTAVSVMLLTVGDYNVLLWVGVGAFNAVNAAVHYAAYQKKKLAFAVFEILTQVEE